MTTKDDELFEQEGKLRDFSYVRDVATGNITIGQLVHVPAEHGRLAHNVWDIIGDDTPHDESRFEVLTAIPSPSILVGLTATIVPKVLGAALGTFLGSLAGADRDDEDARADVNALRDAAAILATAIDDGVDDTEIPGMLAAIDCIREVADRFARRQLDAIALPALTLRSLGQNVRKRFVVIEMQCPGEWVWQPQRPGVIVGLRAVAFPAGAMVEDLRVGMNSQFMQGSAIPLAAFHVPEREPKDDDEDQEDDDGGDPMAIRTDAYQPGMTVVLKLGRDAKYGDQYIGQGRAGYAHLALFVEEPDA